MKEVRYVLMDPSGNRTILVEDPVPVDFQPAVAAELMELEPAAEQAGFLTDSGQNGIDLRMAGGEFCGNAAMSAAAHHLLRAGRPGGTVTVRVSGEPEAVTVELSEGEGGEWKGRVRMPRPDTIEEICFSGGQVLPVVSFRGISHVILEEEVPAKEAEHLIRQWCAELRADAAGMLFLDRKAGFLKPLVYVPAADTLFWESACGSGTSAVGAWLAWKDGRPVDLSLKQPGGMLEISASPDGPLFLKGTVKCLYEKTAEVDFPDSRTCIE